VNSDTPHPIKSGRLPFSKVRLPASASNFKMDHVVQLAALRHPAKAVIYPLDCQPAQQPVTEGPERSVVVADPERFPSPDVM
jgi:hypothetical protein